MIVHVFSMVLVVLCGWEIKHQIPYKLNKVSCQIQMQSQRKGKLKPNSIVFTPHMEGEVPVLVYLLHLFCITQYSIYLPHLPHSEMGEVPV